MFLTSLLPRARQKLKIDHDDHPRRQPADHLCRRVGQGARGPEAEKGGYDSISFWSRGSVSSSVTPKDQRADRHARGRVRRLAQRHGARRRDRAALARKAKTGEGGLVDGSLLGTAMWSMQMGIVGAAVAGLDEMPKGERTQGPNPLVNTYRTSRRALDRAVHAATRRLLGRLLHGDRSQGSDRRRALRHRAGRAQHGAECVAELDKTFATKSLAEWKPLLRDAARPMGRGEPRVRHARRSAGTGEPFRADGRLRRRPRAPARSRTRCSSIAKPPELAPAPEFGADTDEILLSLGWDWDAIIEAKASGAVL